MGPRVVSLWPDVRLSRGMARNSSCHCFLLSASSNTANTHGENRSTRAESSGNNVIAMAASWRSLILLGNRKHVMFPKKFLAEDLDGSSVRSMAGRFLAREPPN